MEEMIIEAIEDAGAQGASLVQILEYIGVADVSISDTYEEDVSTTLDSMMKNRIILSRRGRFFITYND